MKVYRSPLPTDLTMAVAAGALLLIAGSVAILAAEGPGDLMGRLSAAGALLAAFGAIAASAVALALTWRIGAAPGGDVATFLTETAPALVSRVGGRVLAQNDAMAALNLGGERDLASLLSGIIDVDARVIYRLARGAGEVGVAIKRVRERRGDVERDVVARAIGPELIVWSILPATVLATAAPLASAGRYDDAPFAHARIRDGRVVTTNTSFRNTFAGTPQEVLAPVLAQPGPHSRRLPLRTAAGQSRLARVLTAETSEAESGSSEMDVFIFELEPGFAGRRTTGSGLGRIPVALVQIELDGTILWANDAARRMLGPAACAGNALASLIEHRGRPLSSLIEEAMLDEGQSHTETVRATGGAPDTFAQLAFTRVEIDGEDILLGVLTDASELRQLEDKFAQSQKMEAIGKLAGGVAHDFNNLLTAINGHCDLLLLGRDASQTDYSDLMQIKQNANRAAALVRQLLAFSRKQTLNPEVISLKDVVTDTLYLLDRLIGDQVVLTLDHGRDGDAVVRIDRQQIEQALMNLVVNARDAMADGGTVTISTRLRHFSEDESRQGVHINSGAYVELAVADEGSGIDEAVLDKVFDPFFTTKPLGEGTGLGLSTVYGIVKQSGGYIFAENRAEGGACFRILLPQAHESDMAAPEPGAAAAEAKRDLTGQGSILLVEDEASVRSIAARALTLRGYQVTAVDAAREALGIVEDPGQPIDLVVSDVMMPGMDGPSFAARAREIRPGLRVLFVSGYAEEAFLRNMSDPDYAFLAKPFSITELTAKVKEVMALDRRD